ncbi:MAG: hypothetical protein E6Y45_03955, partial [Finegoldia magna]|nr:hypothetical protein [Finegoldia magna]
GVKLDLEKNNTREEALISAVIYGLIYIKKDFYIGLVYILLGIISLFKHRTNINRLIHGKESKLGKK